MPKVFSRVRAYLAHRERQLTLRRSHSSVADAIVFDRESLTTAWVSANRSERIRSETISWADISEIWVHKKDCWSHDQIRMLLYSGNTTTEITEDTAGWSELTCHLHELLPGCMKFEEWFQRVVSPAFAPCFTRIYQAQQKR
jgi:hypothetical protein